jgi:hypothetical protein
VFLSDAILVLLEAFSAVTGSVINGTRRGIDNVCIFFSPKSNPRKRIGATLTALSHGSWVPLWPYPSTSWDLAFCAHSRTQFALSHAALLISLDKGRRAEVKGERHASPNALHIALRERMGRPSFIFVNTLHHMCFLTSLVVIDRNLAFPFTAALCVRRAYNRYDHHDVHSTSMTMEGRMYMRKIQIIRIRLIKLRKFTMGTKCCHDLDFSHAEKLF